MRGRRRIKAVGRGYLLLDKIYDKKMKRWIFRVESPDGRIWNLDDPIIISKLWDYKVGDYLPAEVVDETVLYASKLASDLSYFVVFKPGKPTVSDNVITKSAGIKFYDESYLSFDDKIFIRGYKVADKYFVPTREVYVDGADLGTIRKASVVLSMLGKFSPVYKAIAAKLYRTAAEIALEERVGEGEDEARRREEAARILEEAYQQTKRWILSVVLTEEGPEIIIDPDKIPRQYRRRLEELGYGDIVSIYMDPEDTIQMIEDITGMDREDIEEQLHDPDIGYVLIYEMNPEYDIYRRRERRLRDRRKVRSNYESFEKNSKKWKNFWNSLTGDTKHKMYACMRKVKDWTDTPERFCASLKDFVEGTTYWRGHEKEK